MTQKTDNETQLFGRAHTTEEVCEFEMDEKEEEFVLLEEKKGIC